MVLLGFLFIAFGGIYFMFWASYKIFTWIPWLLLATGIFMIIDFVLDHWIITLILYTIFAVLLYFGLSDEAQNNIKKEESND
ncbi:hypothetical protein H7198_06115 [Fructobacillus sp. CRL 2054]|uniref:hypothetical protein n=1 Tax=Fructobacillus sp. CRL 2054 TaxID=2763007 RepID=UPI0023788BFB|nr:hypothetical protein [Fructobacillus sp. CRL 2054]MDD9139176.1 hypothetical protein [Fructobacillus sp. CRL 2054]